MTEQQTTESPEDGRPSPVPWGCDRCRAVGMVRVTPGETIEETREAIARGHERRDARCHAKHGIRGVRAVQNGKTVRFA